MNVDSPVFNSPAPDFSFLLLNLIDFIVGYIPKLVIFSKELFGILTGLSLPVSLFFLIGIVYCVENLKMIRKKDSEIYDKKVEIGFETAETGDTVMAHRWENATKHISSDNPNDWKQAIIEADIILDDLLSKLGYYGDSIGDKLKKVASGDMKSLNEAWEAHKVRNQIAHEGSMFTINHHEAKNVISMYRKVFEEFYYI